MKKIPVLTVPEEQPVFSSTYFLEHGKGESSKFFPLYKQVAELPEYIWAELSDINNEKDIRKIRVYLSTDRERSKYYTKNVIDKGYKVQVCVRRAIDGTFKVWIRKIKA